MGWIIVYPYRIVLKITWVNTYSNFRKASCHYHVIKIIWKDECWIVKWFTLGSRTSVSFSFKHYLPLWFKYFMANMYNVYNVNRWNSKFISKVNIRRLTWEDFISVVFFSPTGNRPASDTFRIVSGVTQMAAGNRCLRHDVWVSHGPCLEWCSCL